MNPVRRPKSQAPASLLSVVIPAYRQEITIVKDLKQIEAVLKQLRYDYEMIVVVDGRVDATYQEAKKLASAKIKVYVYPNNHGKGYAIRYGMVRTRGDLVAFLDAGMEIDPNGLSMLLEHLEWYRADVIVGSKRHPASQVEYPVKRRLISRLYQLFVKLFTGLNLTDTQAGVKIFRREVLEATLPRLLVKRYAFDLEMLSVARHLGYDRIYEAPIKLRYNFGSLTQASTRQWMLNALIDSLAVVYRLRILRYYDDRNSYRWQADPKCVFKKTNLAVSAR